MNKQLSYCNVTQYSSVCLSESESGSDAFALQTRAVRDGDDFILNGTKLQITHADRADVFLVMANAAPEKVLMIHLEISTDRQHVRTICTVYPTQY